MTGRVSEEGGDWSSGLPVSPSPRRSYYVTIGRFPASKLLCILFNRA